MTGADEAILRTSDGVMISAAHESGALTDLCFVLVHGFTGSRSVERVRRIVATLLEFGSVVTLDMRGHGRSGGYSTLGDAEVHDVAAGVLWARELGYPRVATVGFSLGGAVVLREAGLAMDGTLPGGRVDAVVSVSAPAFWYYRGTRVMRIVHRLVESRSGRMVLRAKRTRITPHAWTEPFPVTPSAAAALLAGTPLLVVHGDHDHYFPVEHAQAIHGSATDAGVASELWMLPRFAHAESSISTEDVGRIGGWVRRRLCGGPATNASEHGTAGGRR